MPSIRRPSMVLEGFDGGAGRGAVEADLVAEDGETEAVEASLHVGHGLASVPLREG